MDKNNLILYQYPNQYVLLFNHTILHSINQMNYIMLINFYMNKIYMVNLIQFYHHIYKLL